jgi:ABC-2 type transport system permease protein
MIKSMIVKEILLLLKEKGTFFWLLGLPILFIVVFASVLGSSIDTITIHYVDQDRSAASQQFLSSLEQVKGFQLEEDNETSLDEQIEKIKNGKMTSLLVIPEGFEQATQSGKQAEIFFYRDAAADSAVAPIAAVLQNVTNGYREGKISATLGELVRDEAKVKEILLPPIQINEIKENGTRLDVITQVVPGYTVMFVFFIMITMVRNFIKDKESGMLARLRSTPMKPITYLVGMWVPNIFVALIQCAVLLTFGHYVYGLHIGDPLSVILIVVALSICVTGIGLALSLWVKSENQGMAFVQIITMGGAILGGLWFPLEFLPPFIQTIARFIPQYWAQHGFQDVMIRGFHLGDIWLSLVVLLAFGIAGLMIALLRFKRYIHLATN